VPVARQDDNFSKSSNHVDEIIKEMASMCQMAGMQTQNYPIIAVG
jgi:hypothetical protein